MSCVFKAEFLMAFGVVNCRVAVLLAHGSVFDDPSDTPFNAIWDDPYF